MGRNSIINDEDILESLYKLRKRESEQLKTVLEVHDIKIHQKISTPNDQRLNTMVKRRKDQKLRLRKFDARHEEIETGAVLKSHRGLCGVERGRGICFRWKEKGQCSKGVSGMRVTIVRNRHRKPNHPLSHNLQKTRG